MARASSSRPEVQAPVSRTSVGPRVRAGRLGAELPYLAFGTGPVVVVLVGLESTTSNASPEGMARTMEALRYRWLASRFSVYCVRRRPGLPSGCTMAQLAAEHADALTEAFGEPVPVLGMSTGGSIALQMAIDRPDAVDRLVLLASACRLSDAGRAVQRRQAELLAAGEYRRADAVAIPAIASTGPGRAALRAAMSLTPLPTHEQARDLIRTIEAENTYDVSEDLHRITAPTLVLGGERDGFYSPELFGRTAAGTPHGRLRLYPGLSHAATFTSRRVRRDALRFLTQSL